MMSPGGVNAYMCSTAQGSEKQDAVLEVSGGVAESLAPPHGGSVAQFVQAPDQSGQADVIA